VIVNNIEDILSPTDLRYQSVDELRMGRLLSRLKIPFQYQKPVPVQEGNKQTLWYPDFTLPVSRGLMVECVAYPGEPGHIADADYRQHVYNANGMVAQFYQPQEFMENDWQTRTLAILLRKMYEADDAHKARQGMQAGGAASPYCPRQ
jgi:hypothetical protein